MSFAAAHESKLARRACQLCRDRKARFRYRGEVRADRDHVLCFECYRSERNRRRAQLLLDLEDLPFLRPTGERRVSDVARSAVAPLEVTRSEVTRSEMTRSEMTRSEMTIAHRRRMLAHLEGTRGAIRGRAR
jgi:hypothetical protein